MPYSLKILHKLLEGKLLEAIGRRVMGTITHVSTQDPVAALTFDDGPHPESTPRLLDILEKHQARATFFMVGEAAQRYPEIVRRAAQAGHSIGNHTWDHVAVPLITGRERRAQMRACAQAIAPYGQRLFRPPYGYQSVASRLDALWLGYQVVTWNVVAYDWLDHDAQWMADHLASKIKPGSMILFHDVLYRTIEGQYASREPILEAVDMLLERFGDRFRFITVPELLQHGRPQLKNWYWQADPDWLNKLGGQSRQYAPVAGHQRLVAALKALIKSDQART